MNLSERRFYFEGLLILLFLNFHLATPRAIAREASEVSHNKQRFIVQCKPGLECTIRAESTGQSIDVTSGGESLDFKLDVAKEEEILHIHCKKAGEVLVHSWALKNKLVGDPDIPFDLDLPNHFLSTVEPPPAKLPQGKKFTSIPAKPDPCQQGSSWKCDMHLSNQMDEALKSGNCPQTWSLLERLNKTSSEILNKENLRLDISRFFYGCGLDGAPEMFHHVIEIITSDRGAWCQPAAAQLLGSAYEQLNLLRKGAESARDIACSPRDAAFEWEFYFRIALREYGRCAEIADQTYGETSAFFQAWLGRTRGDCPPSLKGFPVIEPSPCKSLPNEICLLENARLLVLCGGGAEIAGAPQTLRLAFPIEVLQLRSIPERLEGIAHLLAELEFYQKNYESAAHLFKLLLQGKSGGESGLLSCRLGSALLQVEEHEEALLAFQRASVELSEGTTDHTIAFNNYQMLNLRLGKFEQIAPEPLDKLKRGAAAIDDKKLFQGINRNLLIVQKPSFEAKTSKLKTLYEKGRIQEAEFRRYLKTLIKSTEEEDPETDNVIPCSTLVLISKGR